MQPRAKSFRQSTSRSKPPAWHRAAAKPAGGYVLVRAGHLLAAWNAYRQGAIGLLDLRAWLACHELVARRCRMDRKLHACYGVEELRPLLGEGMPARLRRAVRNLEKAGLMEWQADKITLEPLAGDDDEALAGQSARRLVPVPRRVLRFLAGCGRKVMLATVLGHLLRCLYYRQGQCVSGGRCKASWIADVFSVDARNVKAARKELVDAGWLAPVHTPQTAMNRWGLAVVVNLEGEWAAADRTTAAEGGAAVAAHQVAVQSPPPGRLSTAQLPPLYMDKKLPAGTEHQKLGTGLCERKVKAPDLGNVTVADLQEPRRLEELFRQAVAAGLVTAATADRLRFFAAAQRAIEHATLSPGGFFLRLVRRQLWHHVTNAQEDAARQKIRRLEERPPAGAGAAAVQALVAQVLAKRKAA